MKRLIVWLYMKYVFLPEFRSFRHVKDRAQFLEKYPFDILPGSEYKLVEDCLEYWSDPSPQLKVVS